MLEKQLTEVETKFAARDVEGAMNALVALLQKGERDAKARDEVMAWVIAHVGDDHPQIAAHIALAGGALVEAGAPGEAIARAIVEPVEKALRDAARMIGYAKEYGHAHALEEHSADGHDHAHSHEDGHSHDHGDGHAHDHSHDHDHHDHDHDHEGDDHDHSHGHEHAVEIFGFALSEEDLDKVAARDIAAVRAWMSLEMWYRPAVAAWTRAPSVLRELQRRASLREALEPLGSETPTSHWLRILVPATSSAPFVVLIPEIEEAWAFTADGVVDLGQLTVLLSKELRDPLARIGASGVASSAELMVMDGTGPQSGEGGYSSSFHFYPAEAVDPSDGLPRDGMFTWSAPGGTGSHSLPSDFLPGTLHEVDGVRLLVLVGPKTPGLRFVRIIQSARMFDALPARVTEVRRLPDDQARRWSQLAAALGAQARV